MLALAEFVMMLGIDLMFLAILFLLMMPLGIYRQAAFAVMKRNFSGYFSNPTGYVFLCLFVLLTSFAAFWPHEFFTTNLANFGQLNKYLPYIMLIFIPAITMSIWAEERRQGTDELLLSLPARDFDIVIGKYFAAVLIFTVSLIFSQLSNYAVLIALTGGELDSGLLFSTYLGYWFVGLAMLAIGMVASFLTNNLTVGFIFGAAFNAPLAFFSNADVILSNRRVVGILDEWSLLQRFEPFGRGLISSSSIVYFVGVIFLGVYLSLILIGRRHWLGGRDGTSLFGHYVLRAVFLAVSVLAFVLIVQHTPMNRLRMDVSREKVSTLSESTRTLLEQLADDAEANPIVIDAYVGGAIPTEFVQTRYDLVNLLREFDALGGSRIQLNLYTGLEPFSQDAISAEKRFGIRPVPVVSESRGARRQEDVILGAAFSCGLKREVIGFFSAGASVEYELIRAINSVATEKRKTIGVVQSDLFPTGEVVLQNNQYMPIPPLGVINELAKQYDIEVVRAENPISLYLEDEAGGRGERRYDALIAIQPSKLAPVEMDNLIAAIRSGQPTAIFEDPFTYNIRGQDPTNAFIGPLPPYSQQNLPSRFGTMFPRLFGRVSTESADIKKLWETLGIFVPTNKYQGTDFPAVIWKIGNPYPQSRPLDIPELFVVRDDSLQTEYFSSTDLATTGILELYLPFPGHFEKRPQGGTEVTPLVTSGTAGKISVFNLVTARSDREIEAARGIADGDYLLAARITSESAAQSSGGDGGTAPMNVVYVADIDFFADGILFLHDFPAAGNGVQYNFDNIAFFNNIIDSLTGETDYVVTRSRRIRHATLRYVEKTTEKALEASSLNEQEFEVQINNQLLTAQQELEKDIEPLRRSVSDLERKKQEGQPYDASELEAKTRLLQQVFGEQQAKFTRKAEQLNNDLNEKKRSIRLDAELEIQKIQRGFKLAAVILPVLPPLLLGLIVFTRRRLREREGISKARRLK